MRFDLRAPGASAAERGAVYRTALDMAAFADDHRCASVVVSEHHASDDGYLPSPLPFATAVAAVTTVTPIVVAAAILPFYDPVRLAEDLITLDHVSQGRAMVVLGLGYRKAEYELHGIDFDRRGQVADEKLERLLDVLREAVDATAAPRVTPAPFSTPLPLLAWGGRSKAAARRAGRNGLGFFAQTDSAALGAAYAAAARQAGHEPGICVLPSPETPHVVFVSEDEDSGWDEVGPAMLVDALSYQEWADEAGTAEGTASLSAARTVAELRSLHGAHRVVRANEAIEIIRTHGHLGLHPLCGGLDPDVAWPYLRRAVAAAEQAMDAAAG